MKQLAITISSALLMLLGSYMNAQSIKNSVTATFKVSGNCGMCEKTIETAVNKKGLVISDWNADTKLLTVTYNNKKTSVDEILKRVAYSGYDNEKYMAPDAAYSGLHGCCKYERSGLDAANQNDGQRQPVKKENSQKENQLEQTYALYFEIKDALVSDNAKAAASKAKSLIETLNAVKMEKLERKEHEAFMKALKDLQMHAEHISETEDIGHQRDHFDSLSKLMYELMKTIKPTYVVYLDNCPMYADGKGADWISKESMIKNPYYGSKMLTCGKVKETIK